MPKLVLDHLQLEIPDHTYVVVLGQSGSGKTTLLRVIAGLIRPLHGSVLLDGKCVDKLPPRKRPVSMVFQNSLLYPHLTVRKTLTFGLPRKWFSRQPPSLQSTIDQAVTQTRIEPLLDRYPDGLSGGELRRVAIAKSIVESKLSGNRLCLLDEPLSALDTDSAAQLEQDLRGQHDMLGGTTIHVTHDGDEAMRIADRIAVIHAGKISQFDDPVTTYQQPASIDVALSLGTPAINLLPVKLAGGMIHWNQRHLNQQSIQWIGGSPERFLNDPSQSVIGNDRCVVLGVRPDRFRRGPMPTGETGLCVTSENWRRASLAGRWQATANFGEQRITVIQNRELSGEPAGMYWAAMRDVHVFDAETRLRISSSIDRKANA